MNFKKRYAALCSPAKLYLVITGITYVLLFIQNIRHPKHLTIGSYSIPLDHHNVVYFLIKFAIIVGWTWLLNKICNKGYTNLSWFLVIIPYILMFVAIGLVVVTGMDKHKQKVTRSPYQQAYTYGPPTVPIVPQHQPVGPGGVQKRVYAQQPTNIHQ